MSPKVINYYMWSIILFQCICTLLIILILKAWSLINFKKIPTIYKAKQNRIVLPRPSYPRPGWSNWLRKLTVTVIFIIVSANHPYLQPKGWIVKGAAQQDRLNACKRRLNGCHQTVINDPRAQHPSQMFLTGSQFWRGRKTRLPGEKPASKVEIGRN